MVVSRWEDIRRAQARQRGVPPQATRESVDVNGAENPSTVLPSLEDLPATNAPAVLRDAVERMQNVSCFVSLLLAPT